MNKGRDFAANKIQELPGMLEKVVQNKISPEMTRFLKDKTQNAVDHGVRNISKVPNPVTDEILEKVSKKINRSRYGTPTNLHDVSKAMADNIGNAIDPETGKVRPNFYTAVKNDLDVIRGLPKKEFTPPSDAVSAPINLSALLAGSGSKRSKAKKAGKGLI
jgi:hypothetical protein